MVGFRLAAFAAILLVASSFTADARYIIVGDTQNPQEPWTQIGVNYTQWAIDNPLYVGDVAVFKYRAYYHVVWALPDQSDFDNCVYDRANFIGNDTAGIGPGFFVPVTSEPQYLACGVFGHCEVGQKVVINGTAGPLPARLAGVDVPPPAPPSPPYVPPPPVYTTPTLILAFPPYDVAAAPPNATSPPATAPAPGISIVSPPPPAGGASATTSPPPSSGFHVVPTLASGLLAALSVFFLF